jgi:hypothetical protein
MAALLEQRVSTSRLQGLARRRNRRRILHGDWDGRGCGTHLRAFRGHRLVLILHRLLVLHRSLVLHRLLDHRRRHLDGWWILRYLSLRRFDRRRRRGSILGRLSRQSRTAARALFAIALTFIGGAPQR